MLLYVAMRQGVIILPYDLMFKGVRVLQVAKMILLLDDTMRQGCYYATPLRIQGC